MQEGRAIRGSVARASVSRRYFPCVLHLNVPKASLTKAVAAIGFSETSAKELRGADARQAANLLALRCRTRHFAHRSTCGTLASVAVDNSACALRLTQLE